MFSYCLNNPTILNDQTGMSATRYGDKPLEDVVRRIYEWLTGEEHPSREAERRERKIAKKQQELFEWVWNAYVDVPVTQQALKAQENQMISELFVTPEARVKTLMVVGLEIAFIDVCISRNPGAIIGTGISFYAAFEDCYIFWEDWYSNEKST